MNLSKSQLALQKRQAMSWSGDCVASGSPLNPGRVISEARNEAKKMAKFALANTNVDLWSLYFNSSTQQGASSAVRRVYQGVVDYLAEGVAGSNYGVTEQCDPKNTDPHCKKNFGVVAYSNCKLCSSHAQSW